MVFNLQLFAWTFDTGVGLFDNNTTLRIMDSGGANIKADVETSPGVLASGTNFSIAAGSTWAQIKSYAERGNDLLANNGTGWSNSIEWNDATTNNSTVIKFTQDAFGNITGVMNSGMSFGAGTGVAPTGGSIQALRLTGQYMFNGSSTARADNVEMGGTTDYTDSIQAHTATLLSDLRFNGSNMVVEAKSQYLGTLDLAGLNADVKLTTTSDNTITVNNVTTNSGLSRKITFGDLNTISMISGDANWGTNNIITTTKNTAEIVQNSQLTGVTVVGRSGEDLTFHMGGENNAYIRFGTTSDTINVRKEGANTAVSTAFENVEQVNMNLRRGTMEVVGLAGTNNVTVNTSGNNQTLRITNSNLQGGTIANTNKVLINVADHDLDQADIRAGGAVAAGVNTLTLGLSGAGVESVNIGTHGANATASNWVMSGSTPTGAVSSNVVSIGDHGILAVEGDLAGSRNLWVATHWNESGDTDKTGENGDPSRLQITSKADGSANGTAMGSYEYMNIAAQGNTYKAMVVSDASLQASDTNVNFGVDIVVGDMLNLGDRTDKKVVFLNNGLGKNDWGETVSYSANMTTVKSSTAGGSLIIGDFENSVSLYGAGDQDSLFGGNDYEHDKSTTWALSNYDTLASAAKKKAWMGTSEYSGLTLVDLVHNGQQTNNFGFLGENDETEKTGDVLALMHGAGFTSLKGSEHQLVNFAIGADSANHFMFQSVTEGTHDIMYTYDLGKNNYNGRVDTSLLGSKSGFEYDDSIDFYLGFDKGTVLSFDSSDKNQKLNYDGGAVLMGISTIDGAAGGAGNILNGQENHAEYIAGSATAANTLCGGLKGDADTAADTLVGGSAADTFWVGATMGNDVINNVTDGDTIVFLNSKFADATITHNMLVPGDANVYNVSFSDEAGGATVNLNTTTGKKLSDFKSLTIKFDDATYAWNGTEWSQS